MAENILPALIMETGEASPTGATTNLNTMGDDPGKFSAGAIQFSSKYTLNDYLQGSKFKDEFKGLDAQNEKHQALIDEKFKTLSSNPEFLQDQVEFSKNLPTVKSAFNTANEIIKIDQMPKELRGYVHGLGINTGPAYHRAVLEQPLSDFASGRISEQEAIRQMALKRSELNVRLSSPGTLNGLLKRNAVEPALHAGVITPEEAVKINSFEAALNHKNKFISDQARAIAQQIPAKLAERVDKLKRPEEKQRILKSPALRDLYEKGKKEKRMREAQRGSTNKLLEKMILMRSVR